MYNNNRIQHQGVFTMVSKDSKRKAAFEVSLELLEQIRSCHVEIDSLSKEYHDGSFFSSSSDQQLIDVIFDLHLQNVKYMLDRTREIKKIEKSAAEFASQVDQSICNCINPEEIDAIRNLSANTKGTIHAVKATAVD